MQDIFIIVFFVAFFINLLYELLHSLLYTTCTEAPLETYVQLMLKAAAFDGFAIVMLYAATVLIFPARYHLAAFSILSLLFAYGWEIYSLKKKKWEYSEKMPTVFGAGITPSIQLMFTGILSICIASRLFV